HPPVRARPPSGRRTRVHPRLRRHQDRGDAPDAPRAGPRIRAPPNGPALVVRARGAGGLPGDDRVASPGAHPIAVVLMKSLGAKPEGARLERIKASPLWSGEGFRNVHPVIPGLRDLNAKMPTIGEFICGGERRVPLGPLPSMNPLDTWTKPPESGL